MLNNAYLKGLYESVVAKDGDQPEFLQTVSEVLESLQPVFDHEPELAQTGLMERFVEPERIILFRVPWVDDQGKVQVNRGFRVQFNSSIGIY